MKRATILGLSLCLLAMGSAGSADSAIEKLKENQELSGFATECLYENEAGGVMGARFRHLASGFVLDVLRIQSVPQAFVWVNTIPLTDQGEPHTLEHLLLGKGTKGRYVASLEEMSLGSSSAFTQQLRTCYHFHTSAGPEVFFDLFEAKLDAMLHPNFSDEEIRREVRNMGIAVDPSDSTLSLEEKGTVYNEMVSSFERPWGNLWFEIHKMMYGREHPVSLDSGGYPPDIRTMSPKDIRNFHASTHHLNNMGAVVAVAADEVSLEELLSRLDGIVRRVEPGAAAGPHPEDVVDDLVAPDPSPLGSIREVHFPHQSENEPGLMLFAWPPVLDVDPKNALLLKAFLDNIANGQTSNLYRAFIDSQTRVMDAGATEVFGWQSSHIGNPVYIGLENVKREVADAGSAAKIRGIVMKEIEDVANAADGSDKLRDFNQRLRNRLIERRRELRDFLNSPPRFGYRGTGSEWMDHLHELHKKGGFRRSLALADELEFAEKILDEAGDGNVWLRLVRDWKLLTNQPFGIVTTPDPTYLAESEKGREDRIRAYILDLKETYGVATEEEALARYRTEYDAATRVIEDEAESIELPGLIDDPPMTLDDQLRYTTETLPGGGDLVVSRFDNMTGATLGLAFDLRVVPESMLVYLSALPTLLTDVGVVMDGAAVPYDEMRERLRREILRLDAYFTMNARTERVELVVRASGSDLQESEKALQWLTAVLFDSDLREENLPRLRDAVDLGLGNLRNRVRGSEESWVNEPASAYWKQGNHLILATNSFLTRSHAYHRLRWLLKEAGSEAAAAEFGAFMAWLADAASGSDVSGLAALLGGVSGEPQEEEVPKSAELRAKLDGLGPEALVPAQDALKDLRLSLSETCDASLEEDWRYLCDRMTADLAAPPGQTLDGIRSLLDLIRRQDNVRGFFVSNREVFEAVGPQLSAAVSRFASDPSRPAHRDGTPLVVSRMTPRYPGIERPIFVGLVNENTRSGVHLNSAPCASFMDHDEETLLRFLSARLYGGGGAHSMFMKTWGAGLAYSNGLRSNEMTGRLSYYAERCPDLAQTMQFVVGELENAPYDPSLADYAVAQAFAVIRSGNRYESRGEEMAADIADGLTPDVVRGFRREVLELSKDDGIYDKLRERMIATYGEVLPGLGSRGGTSNGAIYYVIGPEKQLANYEDYLDSVEGDVTLYRIYPRDYWLVD